MQKELEYARGPLGQAFGKLNRGFPEEAIVLCQQGLADDPIDSRAHAILGFALRDAGDARGALEHLLTAVCACPGKSDWILGAAKCTIELGDLESGRTLLTDGIHRFPHDGSLRLALGDDLIARGDLADGIAAYESVALGSNCWMFVPSRESDWWQMRRGQNRAWDAIAVAEQRRRDIALLEEPTGSRSPVDPGSLADAYAVAGLWARAADHYREALREDSGSSTLRFKLARMLARLGNWDEAELHLDAAGPDGAGRLPSWQSDRYQFICAAPGRDIAGRN